MNSIQADTPKSAQLHRGPGFRIRLNIDRPDPELIAKFSAFSTPDISDMLNRLYTMHPEISNYTTKGPIIGPACTVKVYPGDNLMVHKALDVAKPGDIVVIDAGASTMNGLIGDLICTKAKHRGIAGFIVDGLFRDFDEVCALGFPVFARGITPIGPLHRGPGEINFRICCGGIVVDPGDIVVGDANGVVVVRTDFAQDALERLTEQKKASQSYEENVKKGIFDNTWVDQVLAASGCIITE